MSEPLTDRVAANVRSEAARRRCGVTELAKVAGLSRSAMSERLNGHKPFSLAELELLADHFGIPVSDLLNGGKVAS